MSWIVKIMIYTLILFGFYLLPWLVMLIILCVSIFMGAQPFGIFILAYIGELLYGPIGLKFWHSKLLLPVLICFLFFELIIKEYLRYKRTDYVI